MAGAWHADLMGSSVQSTSALPSASEPCPCVEGRVSQRFLLPTPAPSILQHQLGPGIFRRQAVKLFFA